MCRRHSFTTNLLALQTPPRLCLQIRAKQALLREQREAYKNSNRAKSLARGVTYASSNPLVRMHSHAATSSSFCWLCRWA
jgi:hypothetical protein